MSKIHKFRLTPQEAIVYDEKGNTIASVASGQLATMLYGGRIKDIGIMPPAVRWLAADGSAVIVERPPHQRHISFEGQTYTANLPWILWLIRMDSPHWQKVVNVSAFARSFPLSSERDELGILPLPGVKPDGSVKMPPGSSMNGELAAGLTFPQLLSQIPDRYFGQEFTKDLFRLELKDVPEGWAADPMWILNHMATQSPTDITFSQYKPSGYPTLKDLLDNIEPADLFNTEEDALDYLARMVEAAAGGNKK